MRTFSTHFTKLTNQYSALYHKLHYYRWHIDRAIDSCKTEEQLQNTLRWALSLWMKNKRIYQLEYSKKNFFTKIIWLDFKLDLDYWNNQIMFNEVVQKCEERKQIIINTPQS